MDETLPLSVACENPASSSGAAEPAMALFQPMDVVREIDPWTAGQLERLWGCEAFETYVDSLIANPARGRPRLRLPTELINALLALAAHHLAMRKSGAGPGSIDVWLVDRMKLATAIAPIMLAVREHRRRMLGR